MTQPRLFLLSPIFHGYWRSIAEALARRGYAVTSHLYDARSRVETVHHKVTQELPAVFGLPRTESRRPTLAAAAAMRAARPDIVLAIRANGLGTEFWEELARVRRTVLWLYDEVRRTSHTPATLSVPRAIASYSSDDVTALRKSGLTVEHVANGFDSRMSVPRVAPISHVTFIGARYPNRHALLTSLSTAGIPVRAYGRDWSDHPLDRLRTWRMHRVGIPNARDTDRGAAYGVMSASTATINMHFDQDGFTMRTFEAAGVGAVQLIDRADVADLYEPDREIAVFSSPEEAAELARRAHRDSSWANGIREQGRRRTLAEHTFEHRVAELEKLWQ